MKKDVRINIGVIGCANIANKYVIPALIDLPENFNLVGVASREETKAQLIAEKFHTKSYLNYTALIESGLIDAVYIPLPNALHREWVEKALNNKLHVLVEKPLACSYKESLYLNEIAKSKNLVLLENFQFRFHRQLETIDQVIQNGVIGDIKYVRSSFGFPPFRDETNIRYQATLGGGALLDAGAYTVKITQHFLGSNIFVAAASLIYDDKKGIDLWGGAYLKQREGSLFAEVTFGFDYYYQCNLEILGSKGKIYTNRIFTAPPGYSPEVLIETNEWKKTQVLKPDNHFKNMLIHFYRLVTSNVRRDEEYVLNINQSRLLDELRQKAYENE